jgi:2-polyprenyl-6-methoxyphenol hydroxylase-like FAD-dependent oxidoreductase
MLGLLLARAGLEVVVLEKHADFFRDFRGDTIHPSTVALMRELGLRDGLLDIDHTEVVGFDAVINHHRLHPVDFGRLGGPDDFLVLMPQWDFLTFLAEHAAAYPGFHLLMNTEATDLLWHGDTVIGVSAAAADDTVEVHARLTVAADGRDSRIRAAAGLVPIEHGVPIDVLWFQVPRPELLPPDTIAYVDKHSMVVTIPRTEYFQVGMLIPKDGFETMKRSGLSDFRRSVAATAGFLEPVMGSVTRWDQVKLLSVQINRLEQWHRPGLLCIGDAAHAMSPAFGVGINYAIQDAVATANALVRSLRAGASVAVIDEDCAGIEARRMPAVTRMQAMQLAAHRYIARPEPAALLPRQLPGWLRVTIRLVTPAVQSVTARVIGRGFVPENLAYDLVEPAEPPVTTDQVQPRVRA